MTPDAIRHSFRSALAKLRLELLDNLERIDVLDRDKLHSTLQLFNQRLIVAQNDFIQFLTQVNGKVEIANEDFKLQVVAANAIPELATTILAGGGAAWLVNLISFTGSSWLFFTTTTSAATIIGGLVGVSAGIATAVIGAAVGVAAGVGLNQAMKRKRRRKVKDRILRDFDNEVVSQLQAWADRCIRERVRG